MNKKREAPRAIRMIFSVHLLLVILGLIIFTPRDFLDMILPLFRLINAFFLLKASRIARFIISLVDIFIFITFMVLLPLLVFSSIQTLMIALLWLIALIFEIVFLWLANDCRKFFHGLDEYAPQPSSSE